MPAIKVLEGCQLWASWQPQQRGKHSSQFFRSTLTSRTPQQKQIFPGTEIQEKLLPVGRILIRQWMPGTTHGHSSYHWPVLPRCCGTAQLRDEALPRESCKVHAQLSDGWLHEGFRTPHRCERQLWSYSSNTDNGDKQTHQPYLWVACT